MRFSTCTVRAGPTEGLDLIEAAQADSEAEAVNALKEAAGILAGLDADFLKNLPQDLKADAKFSGFQLANGPLDREVGDSAAAVLGGLGRAFESLDAKAAAAAARGLADAAAGLPPKSSERARFGRRLAAFAGPLRSGDCEELKQVARALSAAGKSIAEGAEEKPVTPPSPESKVLKFGNLQVELTRQKAFGGVVVAFVFGFLCARLTAGLQSIEPDSMQYANDSASALAQSLRVTLLAAGWSCTAMSAFSAVGLLALGLQMKGKGEDSS
ncbi:hypothetical protein KFL_004150050 [Klebsormidium nitens]|uniref:Uncharacterized protein n=1 Tax=Klebsormidium nitens TaxID=105231 RepID=A0A1Y1IGU6_KLENI|nr:hypothetical protein KFL_004150050 [Klebsormidium nitens]|eukprot:GAQ88281.1 hypothetical protein KFL_004150050 [Klebsormidium nitens]